MDSQLDRIQRFLSLYQSSCFEINSEQIGAGQESTIYKVDETVLKVFDNGKRKNYDRELECYQLLKNQSITQIANLKVPELIQFDDSLAIIQMTLVSPPCLLDFGKSFANEKPPFFEEYEQKEREEIAEVFETEEEISTVITARWELNLLGIYYYDANPRNVMLNEL